MHAIGLCIGLLWLDYISCHRQSIDVRHLCRLDIPAIIFLIGNTRNYLYVVAQEDCKVEVPQVYHVARQHAQLVAAVIKEAQNAENKRMKR